MQLKQQKAAAIGLAVPIPVKDMIKETPEEVPASVEVPTQEVRTVTEDAIPVVETSAVAVEVEEVKPEVKAEVEKTSSKRPKKKSKAAAAAESTATTATTEATPVKSAKKKGKAAAAAAEPPVTERAELIEKDVTKTDAAAEVAVASVVTEAESVTAVDANESKEEKAEPHLVQLEEVPEEPLPTPVKAQMVAETEKVVDSSVEAEAEELVHTPAKSATASDFVHSTPVPSTTATEDEAGENEAALTPTNAEARPHADSFTSPLVEFHHAYKIKEIGIPVVDNDEGDVNPMKRGMHSPVVNYNNTYPELEEECELLIEMEVDEDLGQSTDDERDTTGPDSASEAGDLSFTFNSHMINSASNSVTSNRSQSKMRDINPMARPSPGKGSRVRLDIAQGMSENDAETVVIASERMHAEDKVDSPGTDAESSGLVEKVEVESAPHKDVQVEQNEASAENNAAEEASVPEVVEVAPGSPARTVRSLRFAVYSGPTIAAAETADSNE